MRKIASLLNINFQILDESPIDKARLLSLMCLIGETFVFIGYNLIYFVALVLNWPVEDSLNPDFFWVFNGIYLFFIAANLLHYNLAGWVSSKQLRWDTAYVYASVTIYVGTHCVACHLIGQMSINTGILLAAAPILGLILFNMTVVIYGIILGSIVLLGSLFKVLIGQWMYAPLAYPGFNSVDNAAFAIFTLIAVTPHVVLALLVSYQAISNWKKREATAVVHAETDALTEIPNRRKFDELIADAIEQSIATQSKLGLVMLDIDNFKAVNDKYGHPIGDKVLSGVIQIISGQLRQGDVVARYGGDEFVILLPNTDVTTAEQISNRCLDSITQLRIATGSHPIKVTASLGVSSAQACNTLAPPECKNRMIKLADDALLEAKRLGKNRVYASQKIKPSASE